MMCWQKVRVDAEGAHSEIVIFLFYTCFNLEQQPVHLEMLRIQITSKQRHIYLVTFDG